MKLKQNHIKSIIRKVIIEQNDEEENEEEVGGDDGSWLDDNDNLIKLEGIKKLVDSSKQQLTKVIERDWGFSPREIIQAENEELAVTLRQLARRMTFLKQCADSADSQDGSGDDHVFDFENLPPEGSEACLQRYVVIAEHLRQAELTLDPAELILALKWAAKPINGVPKPISIGYIPTAGPAIFGIIRGAGHLLLLTFVFYVTYQAGLSFNRQIDDGVYVSPSWAPLARKHIMVFMDKMQTLLLTLHQQTIKVKDFKGKHEWFILPNGDVIEKWKEHVPRFEEVRELAAVYHLDKHWWGRAHRACDPTQDECHYEKSFNKKYEKALKSAIGWLDARPNEIPARS